MMPFCIESVPSDDNNSPATLIFSRFGCIEALIRNGLVWLDRGTLGDDAEPFRIPSQSTAKSSERLPAEAIGGPSGVSSKSTGYLKTETHRP